MGVRKNGLSRKIDVTLEMSGCMGAVKSHPIVLTVREVIITFNWPILLKKNSAALGFHVTKNDVLETSENENGESTITASRQ